ncbi:MAG: TonB-dependent receptor plug domain-containing protein [Opitutaceae bacterium]|nr:TonB-dependent receptor plug domain-containing protein [Opitutaceae bacterium]
MNVPSKHPALRCLLPAVKMAAVFSLACGLFGAAGDGPVLRTGVSPASLEEDERAAEAVVELSPFVVESRQDRGYQASNAMSGTRLNSELADLAASITVINKQQIIDTGAIDINDLFVNEANTEGTRQFNATTADRNGNIAEAGLDPHNANRVRGLSAANVAVNGFGSGIPIDTYNVDSVEISRGPNSTIFGMGNVGGAVNIVPASANLTRIRGNVTLRADSYGGTRGSFDINAPIIKRMLAVRVMGLHEEKGFERKPSVDRTKRMTFAMTAKPFRWTEIKLSWEKYDNFNRRPNTVTPQDYITSWREAGAPTWDPTTWRATVGGVTSTPILTTQEGTRLPVGLVPGTTSTVVTRHSLYVDNYTTELYMINRPDGGAVGGAQNPFAYTSQARIVEPGGTQPPLYRDVGISDRSLYDWTSINLLQPNNANRKAEVMRLSLEQLIVNNDKHLLALQIGLYTEKLKGTTKNFIGTGGTGTPLKLLVDVNEKLLDGTANPYFLRPYFGGTDIRVQWLDKETSDFRLTLAYQLDFTKDKGLSKWLGRHRLSVYDERIETEGGSPAAREYVLWTAPGAATPTLGPVPQWRYYVGDTPGDYITHGPRAPRDFTGAQNLYYLNRATGLWQTDPVEIRDLWYAGTRNRQRIETRGLVWQAFLLDERVLPLLGVRRDTSSSVSSDPGLNSGRINYDMSPLWNFSKPWEKITGTTTTKGIVIKPLRFLSFYYNESDSFSPLLAGINIMGNSIPMPTGEGKDYGVRFSLFKARVVLGVNFYETLDKNTRNSDLNVIGTRAQRMDFGIPTASYNNNLRGRAGAWTQAAHPTWTDDQVAASVAEQIGLGDAFVERLQAAGTAGLIADVNESRSKGVEIEANVNLSRHWTIKLTGAEISAKNTKMGPAAKEYIDSRMAIWTSIKDPTTGLYWWTGNSSPTVAASNDANLPINYYTVQVDAPYKLAVTTLGKSRPQVRKYRLNLLTNYKLSGITSNKYLRNLSAGGSFRYESRGAIGYLAGEPDADGIVRELDANKPVYEKEHFRTDLNLSYTMRVWGNVRARLQLNVRDVFESGRLRPIAVNPDGQYSIYSIIDPRQFIFTAAFDF